MHDDLHESANALYSLISDFLRQQPRDMSLTSVSTLGTLRRMGPQRITALAGIQGVAQPSMTSLVGALEKSGHVRRRPDPADRRATLVELTELGMEYSLGRVERGTDRIVELLGRLPDDQLRALVDATPAIRRLDELSQESPAAAGAK
ncbi:MarR family winged helix-turn-helix transcriptional regulator [Gordonia sp. CPCC 205515]|uniref:MarR family winged helix-turn-helix transcriptional regulator n=1 Tax=Gordonia sp. CPCC 205515 TaxID=3140791 RepID=UPI003AF35F9D